MVVALIALFVALGGPAQAKRLIDGGSIRTGTITTKQIKNGSVAKVDLSKAAVKSLAATPANSVRSPQIADGSVLAPDLGAGSVGAAQLQPGAVTASKLAADSVGGGSVANGSLQTARHRLVHGQRHRRFRHRSTPTEPLSAGQTQAAVDRRQPQHRR